MTRLADDPTCDMGAYEYVRPVLVVVSPSPSVSPSIIPGLPLAGRGNPHLLVGLWLAILATLVGALGIPAGIRARRTRG